jgi:hypothetical protein
MEIASIFALPDIGRVAETSARGGNFAAQTMAQPGENAGQWQGNPSLDALKDQLRDPASLRRAILLREILGTPKGLQSAASPSILPTP